MTREVQIAAMVPQTEAEGPGNRFAVWVQGCPLRCPGCCNPQYLSFESNASTRLPVEELVDVIAGQRDAIEGVTFIGGEPFSQAGALSEAAAAIRRDGLSVMVFTGFTLNQLKDDSHPDFPERVAFLGEIDLLVDGPYLREQHITDRRWIGSANQQVHFLTNRYAELQEDWPSEPNTIEIRLKNGELTINGFPHESVTRESLNLLKRKNVGRTAE